MKYGREIFKNKFYILYYFIDLLFKLIYFLHLLYLILKLLIYLLLDTFSLVLSSSSPNENDEKNK